MKLEKDKKWKWPAENMREWTDDELATKEREFCDQLFQLKFQMAAGQAGTLQTIRELRKGIARVKTIRRERELKPAEAGKTQPRA
jgi:large subunit ribosomal protein L29